ADLQLAIVISTPVKGSVPARLANNVLTNSIFITRLNATFYTSAHNLHFPPGFSPVELKIFFCFTFCSSLLLHFILR
ncbi:hypothetical protein ACJGZO_004723, partial [Escherichia coli]